MNKYTIGIDFGTLSGRAVLVNLETGEECASSAFAYPHAVMDEALPCGRALGHDWALQHPQDYLDVLYHVIPAVMESSGASPEEVIGIGTDFTACTMLPVKADGTPLCFLDEYRGEPHAYVKLWKHHAAQDKANALNKIAAARGEGWLARYGGKISSEWSIPKLWQLLDEAPEAYAATDCWIEAADWIVWQLCGTRTHNACAAGYKAMHSGESGYPSKAFFAALDPRLANVAEEKLGRRVSPLGARAGGLTPEMAERTGLLPGTAVAIGNVDAHVCVPAVGIDGPGKMLAIIGTSTCHMLMDREERHVPGICGVVDGGIMPGLFGYEAGQSCVGDHFAWFSENCTPAQYHEEAGRRGVNLHQILREKAERLRPGQSGLLALDWWNGNRSVLVDADLSGLLLGMTLSTRPEEIYRALIEATAYGTRLLTQNYRENGIAVDEFYASGGISQKDPMMMQIYADVLQMPVRIAGAENGPAYGSAIFAGVAAGAYPDIMTAAHRLGKVKDTVYSPKKENTGVYDRLFAEYRILHDYFGRGDNDVMKTLRSIRDGAEANK